MYAYNPRKKSSEELSQSLVGDDRWDILNGILSELSLKKGESPKQHWMLVGARGMGKSHLLTLLHHKVCADKKLNKLWIPVLFPEEIRMAGDLAKFLERAVNEVQRDLEKEKGTVAADLKDKIARIRSIRHEERVDYLFSLMTWIRRETGRHILLIAENLQQLLGKKISLIDQKKLRAFLQSEDALLLVGSATTIFTALHDHSHPFYHFFHIRRLQELSFEDIKTLVGNLLCKHDKKERTHIMTENEARLRVIHSFTGGNPRMAVFLSDILKTDINEEMMHIMDRILDELTPYFEAIINDTPEYLHDIINTLAAFEPAQSPKEIAEHLEMEQGTVRNYLKQAKESGYVRVAFSKGKSNYYCLNEYLYRTWFQMRDSSHREEMRWLMELMMLLYSKDYIQGEKNRIEQLSAQNMSYYQKLVVQTCEFMDANPLFYKVIELYSVSLAKKQLPTLLKDTISRKIDALFEHGNPKRSTVYELIKDELFEKAETYEAPIMSCFCYLQGVYLYFSNMNDINLLLADYDEFVKPKATVIDKESILKVRSTDISKYYKAILFIASHNYEFIYDLSYLEFEQSEQDELLTEVITTILVVHTIKAINGESGYKLSDIIGVLDRLSKINIISSENIIKIVFNVFLSYGIGVLSTEAIDRFLMASKKNDPHYSYLWLLWTCINYENTEEAQKLLTEKPIADAVKQLKESINLVREKMDRAE